MSKRILSSGTEARKWAYREEIAYQQQAEFCHAVLCCAVLCCAVLCCAVLCCAVLHKPNRQNAMCSTLANQPKGQAIVLQQ